MDGEPIFLKLKQKKVEKESENGDIMVQEDDVDYRTEEEKREDAVCL